VNLIGEHVDYNDGLVLPMAIDRHVIIAAAPTDEARLRLWSEGLESEVIISLDAEPRSSEPAWADYLRGVFAGFLARDVRVPGFDAVIASNLPRGGGLSSSAALEVSFATLLEVVTQHPLRPVEKALLCHRAEVKFAGVPCGVMDQFVSVLARPDHLLLLDCRSRETEMIPFTDPNVSVLIINSCVHHELGTSEYARRTEECQTAARTLGIPALRDATLDLLQDAAPHLNDKVFRRARHVISEIQRTVQAAAAVRAQNWREVGRLMAASHASLRDDYEVSCAELDIIVELAQSIGESRGVIGCRMTGGGFGGCAVALAHTTAVAEIMAELDRQFRARTGLVPELFVSRPVAGAALL